MRREKNTATVNKQNETRPHCECTKNNAIPSLRPSATTTTIHRKQNKKNRFPNEKKKRQAATTFRESLDWPVCHLIRSCWRSQTKDAFNVANELVKGNLTGPTI